MELDEDGNWTLDLECLLVELFKWPLSQIDQTDIESLIPFVFRFPQWKAEQKGGGARRQVFVDHVDWL